MTVHRGSAILAIVLTMAPGAAYATLAAQTTSAPAPAAPVTEPDPAAVEKLIATIDAAIAAAPATATEQDLEARITFVVDQQPVNVAEAALRFILKRKNQPRKLENALNAVLIALRRGLGGTGGILPGGGASLAAGPSVGGGGTGANYTPQN